MIERAGDGATADHLRVGPGSKAVGQRATSRPKALAEAGRGRPVPVEVARAHLCGLKKARACFAHRPSNHRVEHESLYRNGGHKERSSAGARRGAGLSDLCAESVRARARVEGYVRARAVRRSLWSGRLTAARQGR